jgi:Uma2 family endonuclease
MQGVIDQRPRTIMEVFNSLPEGTLAEVIDNALYMSPAPSLDHQELSIKLSSALFAYANANNLFRVFYSPVDLYLDKTSNVVQPDIIVYSKSNQILRRKNSLHGVPDFLIEILSPGNTKHDRVVKKNLYEKFGVQEYWIVDPETRTAIGYTLNEKNYVAIGEFSGLIQSLLLNSKFEF